MVKRKSSQGERHGLLDDQLALGKVIQRLIKENDGDRFASLFSRVMSIRTGRPFLCVYHKGLVDFGNEPFARTILMDDKIGEFILSLISDSIMESSKHKKTYMKNMLREYNKKEGVTI